MDTIVTTGPLPENATLEQWHGHMQNEIDAQPVTPAEISPKLTGRFDCEMGMVCNPHAYYTKQGDIAEYIEGWQEVDAMWKEIFGVGDSDEDYADHMADVEWLRRGC